jgi:hypothetical protein
MNFQGMGCRGFCRWVSLSIEVPLANPGRGQFRGNCDSGMRALEVGTSFHGGVTWKPGRGLICQGLMSGRRFWEGCLSI